MSMAEFVLNKIFIAIADNYVHKNSPCAEGFDIQNIIFQAVQEYKEKENS